MVVEESIYNIIPPKPVEAPKPRVFKPKENKAVAATASTFRVPGSFQPDVINLGGLATSSVSGQRAHAEFGKPQGLYTNDPKNYMKKFAKTASVPSLEVVKDTCPEILKPTQVRESKFGAGGGGPPKKGEAPIMNLVSSKNFVVSNAVEAILAAPKQLQDKTKEHVRNESFGKVPKYLEQIKKDIQAECDYIRELQQKQRLDSTPLRPLSEEERLNLSEHIKAKWESVNESYQGMTHLTVLDTVGKVHMKEKCEAQLLQLEKDLERLNKSKINIDIAA